MITILRLGHRPFRDQRISTHCGLVARAFGADGMIYSGEKDSQLEESIRNVVANWGGKFSIEYEKNWKSVILSHQRKKFFVAHLTVYGLPLEKQISKIRKHSNLLIVIGGEKVPPEVYKIVDINISITSQPHSEVSALAIFLNEFCRSKAPRNFSKYKIKVMPQERGKKTIAR